MEHLADNLASEGVTGIEHITHELTIGEFLPNIGLEGNNIQDSIILESHTPTGIGTVLLTENGDRILSDIDGEFFLSENSFARTFSDGLITVLNDNRKPSNTTRNLVTDSSGIPDNLILESGDNFVDVLFRLLQCKLPQWPCDSSHFCWGKLYL